MSEAARPVSRGISLFLAGAALALVFASSAGAATFNARGSVEQVYVTGLPAGAGISLLDSGGGVVADEERQLARRGAVPQRPAGERLPRPPRLHQRDVRSADGADDAVGAALDGRLRPDHPHRRLRLHDHPRRHQARLLGPSADRRVERRWAVDLPPNPAGNSVPAPTLIEYSGYGYARPDRGPQSGIATLANLMGFTVVDVNMRGTGCSGGAFDFFEPLQNLDGYDVVETVARQPWVAHNKVGMLGISYGGISQLFTGQTRPPSLAAIAPLSVIDQVQTTLYPGGMLNTGFAYAWAQERMREANPADPADPNNGAQSWAVQRVAEGDTTCRDNQDLHPETGRPRAEDPRQRPLRARGRRPGVPDHVRRQDRRPGLHGLPVDRRADRRALPDARGAHDRDRQEVVHVHERHPRGLARSRDLQPPLRLLQHLRRRSRRRRSPRRPSSRPPRRSPSRRSSESTGHVSGASARRRP